MALMIILIALQSLTLQLLYNWFISPLILLRTITFFEAVGIMLFIGFFGIRIQKKETSGEKLIEQAKSAIYSTASWLGVAAITYYIILQIV